MHFTELKILIFHNDILIQINITPSETKQYHHKSINSLFNFSGEKEKYSAFPHVSKFYCEFRQLFPSKRKYPIKGITFERTKTYSTKKQLRNGEKNIIIHPEFHQKISKYRTKTKTHLEA